MRCITNLQLNYVTVICTNVYTMMRFDVSDTFAIEPYACEMTSYVGSRYRINQKEISPKNVNNVPMPHRRMMNQKAVRGCLNRHFRQIQLELKVIQEEEVENSTFMSQSLKVIRRDNDQTYYLEDIFVFQNFTLKAGKAGQTSGLERFGRIGHQP